MESDAMANLSITSTLSSTWNRKEERQGTWDLLGQNTMDLLRKEKKRGTLPHELRMLPSRDALKELTLLMTLCFDIYIGMNIANALSWLHKPRWQKLTGWSEFERQIKLTAAHSPPDRDYHLRGATYFWWLDYGLQNHFFVSLELSTMGHGNLRNGRNSVMSQPSMSFFL